MLIQKPHYQAVWFTVEAAVGQSNWFSLFTDCYRMPRKLPEGNVFTSVSLSLCHYVQDGFHMAIPHDALDLTVQASTCPPLPPPPPRRTSDMVTDPGHHVTSGGGR